METAPPTDTQALAKALGRLRRAMLRDGLAAAFATLGDQELSLAKMAVLMLLDDIGEQSATALCAFTGRSPSAMSRLLDQLVRAGLADRREDPLDRRARWIALTEGGRTFLARFETHRAEAQMAVMAELAEDERALVMRAMELLAAAGARRKARDAEAREPVDPPISGPEREKPAGGRRQGRQPR